MAEHEEKPQTQAALSDGAAVALGSVFARLVKPSAEERRGAKRPRTDGGALKKAAPVVLEKDEEVHEALQKEEEARKRQRENKRAKLAFERNARVVPDAATNAALEKELRSVATQGAVALFNAINKAQRAAAEAEERDDTDGKPGKKKKKTAVSKDKFMGLIKAGVIKTVAAKTAAAEKNARREDSDDEDESSSDAQSGDNIVQDSDSDDDAGDESDAVAEDGDDAFVDGGDDSDVDDEGDADDDNDADNEDDNEDEDEDEDEGGSKAAWLKDDFLTKNSRKLKDFDREEASDSE